ncbi:MAG TPA: hypothetical protein VH186_19930 [Chloroflexia bacterium]|nr:hypothetical protein [Chloroflexia bacterium]
MSGNAQAVDLLTPIPTFTTSPTMPSTPTPTLIVVPPTPTPVSVVTTAPTFTPIPAPTPTPEPTYTPLVLPTPYTSNFLRPITPEQARNFNGFHALLPVYLPPGFKLQRLSAGELGTPRLISIIAEYSGGEGLNFFLNIQATPESPTTFSPPAPVWQDQSTPSPIGTNIFKQEVVTAHGQQALLSYSSAQSSLSWSEGISRYFLTGTINREEIIKIADSLK